MWTETRPWGTRQAIVNCPSSLAVRRKIRSWDRCPVAAETLKNSLAREGLAAIPSVLSATRKVAWYGHLCTGNRR